MCNEHRKFTEDMPDIFPTATECLAVISVRCCSKLSVSCGGGMTQFSHQINDWEKGKFIVFSQSEAAVKHTKMKPITFSDFSRVCFYPIIIPYTRLLCLQHEISSASSKTRAKSKNPHPPFTLIPHINQAILSCSERHLIMACALYLL